MNEGDPRNLLIAIAQILDKAGIPYLVSGGMAVLVWGRPRFTADIDIVVELSETHISPLLDGLKQLSETGHIDRHMVEDALAREGEFNFIDGESGVKVDFWILQQENDFDRSRMERRRSLEVGGYPVSFSSPEDLILVKLLWFQQSESSRQFEDAVSILQISGTQLDTTYLLAWAEKLGLSSFLKEAKEQAA